MLKLKVVFLLPALETLESYWLFLKLPIKNTKHVNEFTLMFFLCCFSVFLLLILSK